PGIMLTGMFIVYVLIRVHFDPSLAPDVAVDIADRKTQGSIIMAVMRMIPAVFIFFMVMGLIMLGVATPTEAAATGVFAAVVLAWFYGGLTWKTLTEALYSGVTVAALLLLIMSCATMFSQLLAFTGATRELGDFVVGLNLP